MVLCILIPLFLIAGPVLAQTTMSAEAFDRYTQGKTLFYAFDGRAYGVERYLEGRRVIWSFLDGHCKEGIWYEDAGHICFIYEDRLDEQCWTFSKSGGGLIARFEDELEETELYEVQEGEDEMLCYGPEVGV
jgi:hypothetical protein